jgi:DNA-directed RNA polymerase subunit M/transcription elongation factor TFIIS
MLQAGSLCSPENETSGITTANFGFVPDTLQSQPEKTTEQEIFFRCDHCNTSLVAKQASAGLTFNCQKCGKPITVPKAEMPVVDSKTRIDEIKRRMIENDSQRTEISGYINQSSIQLHRWQLRLQTLNERKKELEEELRKTS